MRTKKAKTQCKLEVTDMHIHTYIFEDNSMYVGRYICVYECMCV